MNAPLLALKKHWPEYLMEAAELGIFMISACVFTMLLYHPDSPMVKVVPQEFTRRVLMGIAMGSTAVCLIYSPWGKQSGAHMNPSVTFNFWRLGKIAPWDAFFYMLAQFIGGVTGVAIVSLLAGTLVSHPSINYACTLPGSYGVGAAFGAEVLISFVLFLLVLIVSNRKSIAPYTGLLAGTCVALFIIFESPVSGMSMNPARTFASGFIPGAWSSIWIYFLAPPLGMVIASITYKNFNLPVLCAKYHHENKKRCIFCEFQHALKK